MDLQNNQGFKRLEKVLYLLSPVVWLILTDIEGWGLFTVYPWELNWILGGLSNLLVIILVPIASTFIIIKVIFWIIDGFAKKDSTS